MTVKLGVVLPQHECGPQELTDAALAAEGEGLDSIWVLDHVHGRPNADRPIVEGWTSLSFVASKTSSIDVGTLVLRVGIRAPAVVAAMASTLDNVSPGRVWLGLGIGDSSVVAEQSAYGMPQRQRGDRLEELRTVTAQVRAGAPGVRILVGGGTREVLELAQGADGWNFWGPSPTFVEKIRTLKDGSSGYEGELSWASQSFPTEDDLERVRGVADSVIVATGVRNYRDRISRLSSSRRTLE